MSFSQDYEAKMTDYSEKFLAYSREFVKFASLSVNNEDEYNTALVISEVAKDFHLHTSYIGDYLLILKIINKYDKEKELVGRLLKLRLESVIKDYDTAMERIKQTTKNVENESIKTTADDLTEDLTALRRDLEEIISIYQNRG
jgi:hypothetical protein